MSIIHREPSIDASYLVSVHLGEGFQRKRLKCEKLTDRRQVMAKAHNKYRTVSTTLKIHNCWIFIVLAH